MKRLGLCVFFLIMTLQFIIGQTGSIKGIVVDDAGEALIGATVAIKGTANGVMTDENGNFSIKAKIGEILVFSSIGNATKEVKALAEMKVILTSTSQELGEIVVTGITQTDKRLFTGATDKLVASEVKLDGVPDISRALEGRSAGVSVQNVSGTFGTAPRIRVRGATSIYGDSKPLWIVDGVIMEDIVNVSADDLASGDAVTLISSALAGLNADDIESMDILKDGSATSIYGARAMAGVIVVTTKKGKAGVTRINYTGEFSMRLKPSYRDYNIMNSQEQMGVYKELEQKGWLNFSETLRASSSGVYGRMYQLINSYENKSFGLEHTQEAKNGYLRQAEMRNTDWFDELFKTNVTQTHSVSISSGTERATTFASVSALVDPGWSLSSRTQRYTGLLNASVKIIPTVTLDIRTNGSYRKQRAPGTATQDIDGVNGVVKRDFDINPFNFALNSSRTMAADEMYMTNYAPFNIKHELENNYISLESVDFSVQGEMKWKVIPALQLSALGALSYRNNSQSHYVKDYSNQAMAYRAMGDATIRDRNHLLYSNPDDLHALPISLLPDGGMYDKTEHKMLSYQFRLKADWNKVFNQDHITSFTGGMDVTSAERNKNNFMGWGMQYDAGEIPSYIYEYFKQGQEKNNFYYDLDNTRQRNTAFYGSGTYSYKGKYTINGTFRYEGTNGLGKARSSRWMPTWNVAASWNANEEDFFQKFKPIFSTFNIKASYSLTGTPPPASVSNAKAIYLNKKPFRPWTGVGENGIKITDLENSDLTYEKKNEFNLSMNFGFMNDRFTLGGAWYTRDNKDLIGLVNTQGVGGTVRKYANVAKMKTSGVELSANSQNLKIDDFSWSTSFTFSYNKSEIKELKSLTNAMRLVQGSGFATVGKEHRAIYSYRFGGLDKDGLPTFKNSKGEPLSYKDINFQQRTNLDDIIKYEGPVEAPYFGGLGNVFRYKGFGLSVFMTYSFGNKIRLEPSFKSRYSDLDALPKEFMNRWIMPGDEEKTNVPVILSSRQMKDNNKLGILYSAYNYSDARIANGSFIRMKEIAFNYDFSKKILPKQISSLSLKLMATNLFLIYSDKKLKGQDPEFVRSGGVATPLPRQFTLSLRAGF